MNRTTATVTMNGAVVGKLLPVTVIVDVPSVAIEPGDADATKGGTYMTEASMPGVLETLAAITITDAGAATPGGAMQTMAASVQLRTAHNRPLIAALESRPYAPKLMPTMVTMPPVTRSGPDGVDTMVTTGAS